MVAIVWPGPTALVLVYVVAAWAIVGGIAEFAFAFAAGETAGTRALFLLGGLVSIAFGVVLFARPGVGAVHPRAAVRPVRPRLRNLADRRRHPAAQRGKGHRELLHSAAA